MSAPIDPERIAALIDGRLEPVAREQLMRELDASPEGREILADAVHLVRETGQSTKADMVSRPRTSWQRKTHLAIAAGIAIAAIGVVARLRGGPSLESPGEVASSLRPTSASTALDVWPLMRGGAAAMSTPARVAIRVGALALDLETRAAGDPSAMRITANIAALLESIPVGTAAARQFRELDASASADRHAEAIRGAELVAGSSPVRVGALLEGIRLASESKDSIFFAALSAGRLRAMGTFARESGIPTDQVSAFEAAIQQRPMDWAGVRDGATRLMSALGK